MARVGTHMRKSCVLAIARERTHNPASARGRKSCVVAVALERTHDPASARGRKSRVLAVALSARTPC